MRRILIESARHDHRLKHGGGHQRCPLTDSILAATGAASPLDPLALDEALSKLEREDAAKAELVKLRFVAGLSMTEAAALLKISRATADRWWAYARAFLYCELHGG
jgi:DNA-directed RNA polymerase specialized sigma24 family protein